MTRPEKNTVEYIPLDCQFSDSIQAVENLYGNDGYIVWVKLLQKLGRTENYIIDVRTELKWSLFYTIFRIEESRLISILNLLANLECIDKKLWEKKIIYSRNLVKRISSVYRKRKYSLKSENTILEEMGVMDDGNLVKGARNSIKGAGYTQSKVKESKVKKTIVNKEEIYKEEIKKFGEFKNVFLNEEQVTKLKAVYSDRFDEAIEILSSYIESKNVKYKNHYAVLGRHNWVYRSMYQSGLNTPKTKQEEGGEYNGYTFA